jgi:diguanylate cyclase (GGDEF)-like protein
MQSHATAEDTRELMGRVAAWMFTAGSLTTVAAIVLPHSPEADIAGFWGMAAGLALVSGFLFSFSGRLPSWAYQCTISAGSLIVALSLYFNGERHGGKAADNEVLFVWIALYAGYFFTRTQLITQLIVAAGAYGVVLLAIHPGQVGYTRWLITVGMISTAGGLVHVLKHRNDHLVTRLFEAVRTDVLTGLVNRQGFDEHFELELQRSHRTAQPVALILADIDEFKQVNDRFGHPAGDAVLTAIGQVLRDSARELDIVARIGGDEFAAILPATTAASAQALAARMRGEVAKLPSASGEPLIMSFGIVECPSHGSTRETLVQRADAALYAAKARRGAPSTMALPLGDLQSASTGAG